MPTIKLINCSLTIKWIGTQQDWEIHEWNHRVIQKPIKTTPTKYMSCKSPKPTTLKNATTSTRFCLNCQEYTTFIHPKQDLHSHCRTCGATASSRGKLNTQINRVLNPNRGKPQQERCK